MGLAAVSVAGMQISHADSADNKVWSASASLRGFYDDNYATVGNDKKGSYGLEFSPTISASVPLRQTDVGIRYTYGLYYYEERDHLGENAVDQSHQLDVWLDHAFSESQHAKVDDTFVVGQEPELLQGGTEQRVKGDNIANNGKLDWNSDWSREFSTDIGYQNHFYDYQQSGFGPVVPGGPDTASLAGLLNRDENDASIDLQYHISSHTLVYVGYQFGIVNYTGDETIALYQGNAATPITSKSRDNISNYGYVGAGTDLLANLRFEGRAGIQYVDYNNSGYYGLSSQNEVSPYAQISLTYTYVPGSYVQLGFNQGRTSVDLPNLSNTGRVTQDQETSSLYGSINHQITSRLVGSVIGQWSHSTFNQGAFDGEADDFYTVGLNLTYNFNRFFSAEVGYNYDDLQSDVAGRGYTRNRVYLGVTATY